MFKNVEGTALHPFSSFRKIAFSTWKDAKDPSVYGWICLDIEKLLIWIEEKNTQWGIHLNLNHIVSQAATYALHCVPQMNGFLKGKNIFLRKHIDVFHQMALPYTTQKGGWDVTGFIIRKTEKMSLQEFYTTFQENFHATRCGKNHTYNSQRFLTKCVPNFLMGFVLDAMSFLSYRCNINLTKLGIPRDPFGSLLISNVGILGCPITLMPLPFYTRVPILLGIGNIQKQAVVVEGDQIKAHSCVHLSMTFDHRLVDGRQAGQFTKAFLKALNDPDILKKPIFS